MIAENDFVIHEDVMREKKGHWNDVFGSDRPLYLEIGMGKGQFITEMALRHRDRNYVGIEKYSSVLLRAIEKREQLDLDNLLFLRMNAEILTEVFGPDEVSGIYLNFSDPWPKDRYAKRRLPGRAFLARYDQVLTPDGFVEFKTDNRTLFDFALEETCGAGWHLDAWTFDLHHDPELSRDNIITEYEERYLTLGKPICKMRISRSQNQK